MPASSCENGTANDLTERRQKLVQQRIGGDVAITTIIQHPGTMEKSQRSIQLSHPILLSDSRSTWFPLTPDHRLLHVIALNVTRAILINYEIMSLSLNGPTFSCSAGYLLKGAESSLPVSFHPTALQKQISHFGWIDLLPSAPLRNNLIIAFRNGKLDEDEFLNDLVGGLFANLGCSDGVSFEAPQASISVADGKGDAGIGSRSEPEVVMKPWDGQLGLISWSDPWDIAGWEVTDSFARKWSFLLHGCSDVKEATNKWRLSRDEPCLFIT